MPIMSINKTGETEWVREYTTYGDPLESDDKESIDYSVPLRSFGVV